MRLVSFVVFLSLLFAAHAPAPTPTAAATPAPAPTPAPPQTRSSKTGSFSFINTASRSFSDAVTFTPSISFNESFTHSTFISSTLSTSQTARFSLTRSYSTSFIHSTTASNAQSGTLSPSDFVTERNIASSSLVISPTSASTTSKMPPSMVASSSSKLTIALMRKVKVSSLNVPSSSLTVAPPSLTLSRATEVASPTTSLASLPFSHSLGCRTSGSTTTTAAASPSSSIPVTVSIPVSMSMLSPSPSASFFCASLARNISVVETVEQALVTCAHRNNGGLNGSGLVANLDAVNATECAPLSDWSPSAVSVAFDDIALNDPQRVVALAFLLNGLFQPTSRILRAAAQRGSLGVELPLVGNGSMAINGSFLVLLRPAAVNSSSTRWAVVDNTPYRPQSFTIAVSLEMSPKCLRNFSLTVAVRPNLLPSVTAAALTTATTAVSLSVVSAGGTIPGITSRMSGATQLLAQDDGSNDDGNGGGILKISLGNSSEVTSWDKGAVVGNFVLAVSCTVLLTVASVAVGFLGELSFRESFYFIHFPSTLVPVFATVLPSTAESATRLLVQGSELTDDVIGVVGWGLVVLPYVICLVLVSFLSPARIVCVPVQPRDTPAEESVLKAVWRRLFEPTVHWVPLAALFAETAAEPLRRGATKSSEANDEGNLSAPGNAFISATHVLLDEIRLHWYPVVDVVISVVCGIVLGLPRSMWVQIADVPVAIFMTTVVLQLIMFIFLRPMATVIGNLFGGTMLSLVVASIAAQWWMSNHEAGIDPRLIAAAGYVDVAFNALSVLKSAIDIVGIFASLRILAAKLIERRKQIARRSLDLNTSPPQLWGTSVKPPPLLDSGVDVELEWSGVDVEMILLAEEAVGDAPAPIRHLSCAVVPCESTLAVGTDTDAVSLENTCDVSDNNLTPWVRDGEFAEAPVVMHLPPERDEEYARLVKAFFEHRCQALDVALSMPSNVDFLQAFMTSEFVLGGSSDLLSDGTKVPARTRPNSSLENAMHEAPRVRQEDLALLLPVQNRVV